jgi:hypothetical protein
MHSVQQYSAAIPGYSPLENLSLTVATPALDPVRIDPFTFDLIDTALLGISGRVGPFTLDPPQLVLGTVSLQGDDVVLSSGYVQLPGLDLGAATLRTCFGGDDHCYQRSIDLPTLDPRRVDLPGGDLVFEGANPFKGTQINAGAGFALVGSGSISSVPGHITLSGELTLDLPDPTFSFDFDIGQLFEDGSDSTSIGPFTIDGPDITIEIPPVSVSHTFIDEDFGPAFSGTFDGALCLAVHTMDCATVTRSMEQQSSSFEATVQDAAARSVVTAGGSTSGTLDEHAGGALTDAEADLIAMSQAAATIDTASSITLEDDAQRGLRAMRSTRWGPSSATRSTSRPCSRAGCPPQRRPRRSANRTSLFNTRHAMDSDHRGSP